MPSYKRYAKKYYKRKFKKSKFSKYNTYKNRSAKSQANQIYTLNKKVNNIYKQTKKNTHFADMDISHLLFDNWDTEAASGLKYITIKDDELLWNRSFSFDGDQTAGNQKTFIEYVGSIDPGTEKIVLKNGVITINISPKYDPSSLEVDNIEGLQGQMGFDFYVVQFVGTLPTNSENVLFGTQTENVGNYVFKPLNSGCWQYLKILKHKRVLMNNVDVMGKTFRMKFKPYYKTLKTSKLYNNNNDNITHTLALIYRMHCNTFELNPRLTFDIGYRQYFYK